MRIAAIILAAGQASRFGSPKQLLKLNQQTLVERSISIAIASSCEPIIVVTGAYHSEISRLPLPTEVTLVHNSNWADGMGRSIACGVEKLKNSSSSLPDAILIMLADQPGINTETIQRLKSTIQDQENSIVLCQNSQSKGPPALFSISHLNSLYELKHDEGAKSIIASHPKETTFIPAPESIWDIDTPQIWKNFRTRFK